MKAKDYVSKNIVVVLLFTLFAFFIIEEARLIQEYQDKINTSMKETVTNIEITSKPREIKMVVKKAKKKPVVVVEKDTSSSQVLKTFSGTVSHYGPDCVGCSGITASGYKVKNTIYYQDSTFGTLRIVAADKSIPLGSVLRLTNGNKVIHAIVLDRGGGIGFSKRFILDLLCESEKVSYQYGIMKNTKVEVLRFGY